MAGKKLLASVVAGLFLAVFAATALAGGAGHRSGTSGKSGMKATERTGQEGEQVFGMEDTWRIQDPTETGQYPIRWDQPLVQPLVGGQEVRSIELGP